MGEHPPRERGEILRRAFELMIERADDLALLMTLEMGKPVAESKAEISYAAEFLRWFAEEAVRIDGRYQVHHRQGTHARDEAAGRPLLPDHAVELPRGDGHAQDRPRGRGGVHDGAQAGEPDAVQRAGAHADPDRVRACRPASST